MEVGQITASWQNHNGVKAVVEEIYGHLGQERAILIGAEHPQIENRDGVWLPSRRFSKADDFYDLDPLNLSARNALSDALNQLEIAHFHSGSYLTYAGATDLGRKSVRPKVVFSVHTNFPEFSKDRYNWPKSSLFASVCAFGHATIASVADLILFPSMRIRRELGPVIGLRDDDPRVAIWSAPVREFPCEESNPIVLDLTRQAQMKPGTRYLFASCRIAADKHLDRLIRQFAWINCVIDSGLVLVIAGFGDTTPYRVIAEENGIADKVFFPGQISEGTVCALAKKAVASYSHCVNGTQEIGNLRHMLCGIPLIAPKDSVLSDYIDASDCGVAFDGTRDFLSAAETVALDSLLNDREVNAEKGDNARRFVQGNFSPERQFAALDEHYARLLAG